MARYALGVDPAGGDDDQPAIGTLEQELQRSGLGDWIVAVDDHHDGTVVVALGDRARTYGDEDAVLDVLAPFVSTGEIHGEDEEGEVWRYSFADRKVFTASPVLIWPPAPEPYRIPLPGDLVAGRPVIASVMFSDVQVEDTPPDRFDVLLLRLMPETPYFEVGVWDCRAAGEPTPHHQARHENIVAAVRDYEQSGGDI